MFLTVPKDEHLWACPQCGGFLTAPEGEVECGWCGIEMEIVKPPRIILEELARCRCKCGHERIVIRGARATRCSKCGDKNAGEILETWMESPLMAQNRHDVQRDAVEIV